MLNIEDIHNQSNYKQQKSVRSNLSMKLNQFAVSYNPPATQNNQTRQQDQKSNSIQESINRWNISTQPVNRNQQAPVVSQTQGQTLPGSQQIIKLHTEEEKNKSKEQEEEQSYKRFNPLKMPCDWNLAAKHALARRTAPDFDDEDNDGQEVEICQCCGFEVARKEVNFWDSPTKSLSFLGSGFPLFFNFIKFCVLILLIQTLIQGIYNLKTNYEGNYCQKQLKQNFETSQKETICPQSILLKLSYANKLDTIEEVNMVSYLNFIQCLVIMFILIYFRKSQRQLDTEIDESQLTPADYTVCVKNIPIVLEVDYKEEIKTIFENYAVLDSGTKIQVKKIVLVYDINEIIEQEEALDEIIQKKKKTIIKNNYDFKHPEVIEIDEKIEQIEKKIEEIEKNIQNDPMKFAGIAFVSFFDEEQKQKILEDNIHTLKERMLSFFNRGQTPNLGREDLSWNGQKLFVEQAIEPNDVDWEFLHTQTKDKILMRIKSFLFYFLFELLAFYIIYLIQLQLALMNDKAHEEMVQGTISQQTVFQLSLLSHSSSFIIVLFNKFGVAYVLHIITDNERISGKTRFQISFARKYSVALFLNAAMISYVVDIVLLKNIYGPGGFLFNESQIFVLNAFFPPLVWLIDPWYNLKNLWRKGILMNQSKALYTQAEANKWMENPDYLNAKRYSDIMKTMWFTFLYATAIPLGPIVSCLGLICYYQIDKYNLLFRRTVKESISIVLSNEMIQMLELIVIFSPIGSMTMSWAFFKTFTLIDTVLLLLAILYLLLPTDLISEYLFPVINNEEPVPYDLGRLNFDTDYDRENPITRREAIEGWNREKRQAHHLTKDSGDHHMKNLKQAQLQGGVIINISNYAI